MAMSTGQPAARESVEDEVRRFLEAKTKVRWEVDQDLFDSGVVSSMFAMELVVYLEKTFGIAVLSADLQMANFRSVRAMADLVVRLGPRGDGGTGGAGGGGGAEAVLAS